MSKKSFILYADLIETVGFLDDENLGKLFRAILQFQNGQTPEIPENLKFGFEFLKLQFQRDSEKYSNEVEKRRLAGIKSGEARKLKSEQERTKRTHVQFVEQDEQERTKRTDNVNDTDNDIISSLRSEINLNDDLWSKFLEHRKKLKSPATLEAQKLSLEKLKRWKEQGHDIEQIIKDSIENGWKGLFEPKDKPKKQIHSNFNQQNYETGNFGFFNDDRN
jgi:hypothetical protein